MTDHATTFPAVLNLTPILPLLPFAAFALIVLFAHRSKKLSAGLAIGRAGAVPVRSSRG